MHVYRSVDLVYEASLSRAVFVSALVSLATSLGDAAWSQLCDMIRDHNMFDPNFELAMRSYPDNGRSAPHARVDGRLLSSSTGSGQDGAVFTYTVEEGSTRHTVTSPTPKGAIVLMKSCLKVKDRQDRKTLKEQGYQDRKTLKQKRKLELLSRQEERKNNEEKEDEYWN